MAAAVWTALTVVLVTLATVESREITSRSGKYIGSTENIEGNEYPVFFVIPYASPPCCGIAIDYYNGKYLASRGIVVVTFNSRVGNFGFFNLNIHDALGNHGIFDQSTALKWIDPNMAEFEGDMNNMTLFGEGSGSVSFHLTNNSTRHYANKAILFGGTGYFPPYIMDANSSLGLSQEFAELAKCADKTKTVFNNTQEVLECLQSKPADDFLGY
ncbi:BCHE [Cordylochernes scorpioides]|uniref:BCHE n=1 Tax=Cordylochernes scorpioides TaxID=51811 RepID=A0ABY6KQU2_9ARAC|nr:BCHE [Cordylochernes scorpioides]